MGMILGNQKRFLCNYRIPTQLRVKVLESVVLTSGLYGAEVWGGNKDNALKVQKELYKGLNYILQTTNRILYLEERDSRPACEVGCWEEVQGQRVWT